MLEENEYFPDCKGQFRKLLRPKEQIIKKSINLITSKLNCIIEDTLKLKTSDTRGKTCYRQIKKIHFYKWGLFQAIQSSAFLFIFLLLHWVFVTECVGFSLQSKGSVVVARGLLLLPCVGLVARQHVGSQFPDQAQHPNSLDWKVDSD